MVEQFNQHEDVKQDAHLDSIMHSKLTPLQLNEGFSMDHNGNLIASCYVDFRMPDERSPIGAVIKCCQSRFAIERSRTIMLAKPQYFRQDGETLIYDSAEGLATKETIVRHDVPISAVENARMQSLNDDINRAIELSGRSGTSINITLKSRTVTHTEQHNLEWGNDRWLFCTAIEPTSVDERKALLEALCPAYDHESYIPSPRTFAQMLGRAYVEQYGAPHDANEPLKHTVNGAFVGSTYHRQMLVVHGPVVYVDDPYATCTSALAAQNPLIKTFLPIFVKRKEYSGQREYRFVIPDKTHHEANYKIMPVTAALVAAGGLHDDGKGPMFVPEFDTTEGEPVPPTETTRLPQISDWSNSLSIRSEMAEPDSASSVISDRYRTTNEEEPPNDFHEAVGVYPAVATLHEKIDQILVGIAAPQPERKPFVTSAAWYAERSIRKLCHKFGNPITGISVAGDDSIVIDICLPHWRDTECKLAVMSSGAYALTLKRKNGGTSTSNFSYPMAGEHDMSTSLDERHMDAIANFEPHTSQTP